MKTFQEFLEEAYLVEMRKEDKVKGKGKHHLESVILDHILHLEV